MSNCAQNGGCQEVPGFSLSEKVLVRVAFLLGIGLGAWGIWPYAHELAIGYSAYAVISYGLLVRYTVCARCPHLKVGGDCLFMPAPLTMLLISDRSGPLTLAEHLIIISAVAGSALIPLYWLASNAALLAGYLLVTGGWMAFLYLRICTRCQVEECPLRKYAQNL